MDSRPDRPSLVPQLCFSPETLRDFLRSSRSTLDDSISQNLNALAAPARAGFDPSSTAQRTPRPTRHFIDAEPCGDFKDRILFPAWHARTQVLDYCAMVATSPDPDDPDAIARELEDERQHSSIANKRLDPYSGRYFPREVRTEKLAALVRQEKAVEEVVRNRTWGSIRDRCAQTAPKWQDALAAWEKAGRPEKP